MWTLVVMRNHWKIIPRGNQDPYEKDQTMTMTYAREPGGRLDSNLEKAMVTRTEQQYCLGSKTD